jgi:hypothetical protein
MEHMHPSKTTLSIQTTDNFQPSLHRRIRTQIVHLYPQLTIHQKTSQAIPSKANKPAQLSLASQTLQLMLQSLLPLRNMQLRQIKPNPSSRKTDLLFLIHSHTGVIALKELTVDTLGAGILSELICFLDAEGAFLVCFWD